MSSLDEFSRVMEAHEASGDRRGQHNSFKDNSTDCAICLCPLEDINSTDSDGPGPSNTSPSFSNVITLSCGHRWHLSCISEQLRHAQPDRSKRILFSGCRCAKCGAFCDHDALRHLTRRTDELRERVDALIEEQLKLDAPSVWRSSTISTAVDAEGDTTLRARLIDEGRRRYAFYLCSSCDTPYFGGTIDCADELDGGEYVFENAHSNQGVSAGSANRSLCPSCTPTLQSSCRDPIRHRGHHVWKCRYCCRPATHVCYGSVHFCDFCHDRNSERVREIQRGNRHNCRSNGQKSIPSLSPVLCPGGKRCPYPKPHSRENSNEEKHCNGSSANCEQVYFCAMCRSPEDQEHCEPFGSENLLQNPSGDQRLRYWRQLSPRSTWRVEESDIPASSASNMNSRSYNFVSNFQWCVQAQHVLLHHFVRDPSTVRIEVAAKYMGRTDCPSFFRMEALIRDVRHRVLHRLDTGQKTSPADAWERTSLVFDPTPGAYEAIIIIWGKDARFWQGNYGSKVADCSIRVLCDNNEQLQNIMLRLPIVEAGNIDITRTHSQRESELQVRRHIQSPPNWQKQLFDHLLIPIVIFVLWWINAHGETE